MKQLFEQWCASLLIVALLSPQWLAACELDRPATVIAASGAPHHPDGKRVQVWEIDDAKALWSDATPGTAGYQGFLNDLKRSGLETDPVRLLQTPAKKGENAADLANRRISLQGAGSWIKPASCIEKILIGIQNERMPILERSTEFAAMIMRSSDQKRVRIYHFTRNADAVGNVSELMDSVSKAHREGWSLYAALHNHNFRSSTDLSSGVLAPSSADAQLQQWLADEFQLAEAWITNGVNTIHIPRADFVRFTTTGGDH